MQKHPKILFVCKGNMFRSQIAEAIAAKIIGKENVKSAGTYTGAPDEPEGLIIGEINRHSVYVNFMEKHGFPGFGLRKTKRVTQDMIGWADIVVNMAEDPYNLDILVNNPKVIFWEIENPIFQNYSFEDGTAKTVEIYGILSRNIENLIKHESA
jgi:protein-tyrosine-phosphatase